MSSIFSKIIERKIPSHKIYENDLVYAFLDINPIYPGHTLIVPKIEVDKFTDVPEPYYSEVFKAAKKIAPAIQKAIKPDRVGCFIEGFDVPHFHYHLIPIFKGKKTFSAPRQKPTNENLESISKTIIKNLD